MLGYVALAVAVFLLLAMAAGTILLCAICFSGSGRPEGGGAQDPEVAAHGGTAH
jgi:hypothetical protein